ncbi:MAG TPA: DUF72 domain-containing protein [Anaerolineales bacterium]|nr:DUF72 domain-containing protein [Anaerolineales bacterium]
MIALDTAGTGLFLGTQGFAFDDWVGAFYPPGTRKSDYLEAYARVFSTVEIDSTFYGTPRPSVVQGWAKRTPPSFRFAAKFPRIITHEKKLLEAQIETDQFIEVMQLLGEKLAILTLQFAFDFTPDLADRLETFLARLPSGPRYAVEVRNPRWLTARLRQVLAERGAALVLQDLFYMPRLDWVTTDFTVIRWLGRRSDIHTFDRPQIDRKRELRRWAERVRAFLHSGVDVYGYFNNHFAGHSPASVRLFESILGSLGSALDLPAPTTHH